jgi:hypothetical protein
MNSVEAQMDGYVVHGGMGMARGTGMRIEDGAGILVYVRRGELWITQEGDSRDHFVSPGRCFRLERNGVTLLYAMRQTQATLTAPTPANYARLISLTPAGSTVPQVLDERSREVSGTLLARLRAWQTFLETKAGQSPR